MAAKKGGAKKKKPSTTRAGVAVAKASARRRGATAKPTREPRPTAASAAASGGDLAELLSDLPRITDADREAFRAQFSDEECVALGQRTRAPAVAKEASRWAMTMHAALRAYPNALRRYGAMRFVWFLECVRALEQEVLAQASSRTRESLLDTGIDLARVAAIAVRNDLRETLALLAGNDRLDRDALATAEGTHPANDAALASSLRALADLAHSWLSRTDGRAKSLIASVSLTEADVDSARSAASSLEEAASHHEHAGNAKVSDAPDVNRAEGRVLLEMRLARGIFARARQSHRWVPALDPGAATRKVLAAD